MDASLPLPSSSLKVATDGGRRKKRDEYHSTHFMERLILTHEGNFQSVFTLRLMAYVGTQRTTYWKIEGKLSSDRGFRCLSTLFPFCEPAGYIFRSERGKEILSGDGLMHFPSFPGAKNLSSPLLLPLSPSLFHSVTLLATTTPT